MESLFKDIQLILVFLKASFLYMNDLPDDIISSIAIYTDDTKCDQVIDLWQ